MHSHGVHVVTTKETARLISIRRGSPLLRRLQAAVFGFRGRLGKLAREEVEDCAGRRRWEGDEGALGPLRSSPHLTLISAFLVVPSMPFAQSPLPPSSLIFPLPPPRVTRWRGEAKKAIEFPPCTARLFCVRCGCTRTCACMRLSPTSCVPSYATSVRVRCLPRFLSVSFVPFMPHSAPTPLLANTPPPPEHPQNSRRHR